MSTGTASLDRFGPRNINHSVQVNVACVGYRRETGHGPLVTGHKHYRRNAGHHPFTDVSGHKAAFYVEIDVQRMAFAVDRDCGHVGQLVFGTSDFSS